MVKIRKFTSIMLVFCKRKIANRNTTMMNNASRVLDAIDFIFDISIFLNIPM
jgi:hypothetical protein